MENKDTKCLGNSEYTTMYISTKNRKGNCGRPIIDNAIKLVPIKGSIEYFKKLALQRHADKKQNEKELRDFLNFCANFAYDNGGYEKAIKIIQYAIKTDTNKSCGGQCGSCDRNIT